MADGLVRVTTAGQTTMKGNIIDTAKDEEEETEHCFLRKMLNKTFRIKISDGRTLVGTFLCTDKDQNIVLGQCQEYVKPNGLETGEEARMLGLAMIPGRHIINIDIDTNIPDLKTSDYPLGSIKLQHY